MALANPPPDGPRTVEVVKTEEKGSDVALATYLMLDGCRKDCGAAVVITNDGDLREPCVLPATNSASQLASSIRILRIVAVAH
jgi:hypothetical protein